MIQAIPLLCLFFTSFPVPKVSAQFLNTISLQTGNGLFIGTRENVDRDGRTRRDFYSFTGIPYAKPPLGERRWQAPELLEVTNGTTRATGFGPQCPQKEKNSEAVVGSENCLFLNIYTPSVPSGVVPVGSGPPRRGGVPLVTSRPLLPVIVFLHGGAYERNSADIYGPRRFMKHDVVLVTINFRLGVFGYLSTGDGVIDGNFAGQDQIVALKWIEKYIRGFGGNPGRVTIMGHSSGAAAAHLLMLSPQAFGLFHGAILQSGNAFCDSSINENPKEAAIQIGNDLGCDTDDSEELLECLMDKPVEDLINAQTRLKTFPPFPAKLTPVVDGFWKGDEGFLPDSPKHLMEAGAFAQVPVMAGLVHDEGLLIYSSLHVQAGEKFKDPDYFENEFLPGLLDSMMDASRPLPVTVDAIKAQYFQEIDVINETKRVITELVQMLGDQMFTSCHYEMLEKFAETSNSSLFSYIFSHKTPSSPSLSSSNIRKIRQMGIHHPLFNYGVGHGDDLFYLFDPMRGSSERLGAEDERVVNLMTRAWVGFATTGNPASGLQSVANSVPWRPIRPGNINFYNITALPSPMGEDFRKGEALFWLRTVPYIQQLGNTISDLEDYPTFFWIVFGIAIFLLVVTLILACLLWRARSY